MLEYMAGRCMICCVFFFETQLAKRYGRVFDMVLLYDIWDQVMQSKSDKH